MTKKEGILFWRKEIQEILDNHNLSIKTHGCKGSYCLNANELINLLNLTDEELFKAVIKRNPTLLDFIEEEK